KFAPAVAWALIGYAKTRGFASNRNRRRGDGHHLGPLSEQWLEAQVFDLLSDLDQTVRGGAQALSSKRFWRPRRTRSSIEQPRRRSGLRYLADLGHQSGTDRNAVAKARLGQLPLRISGHHHRLRRVDRGRRPERSQECRHIGLKITHPPKDCG